MAVLLDQDWPWARGSVAEAKQGKLVAKGPRNSLNGMIPRLACEGCLILADVDGWLLKAGMKRGKFRQV